ncbi:MAG: hypothetical protein FJW56_01950 [Actinobacteria bacterium]|nr:hypothetical protein [Actinomycetota bacterium]
MNKFSILKITLIYLVLYPSFYYAQPNSILRKFKFIVIGDSLQSIKDAQVDYSIFNKENKYDLGATLIKQKNEITQTNGVILDSVRLIKDVSSSWFYGAMYYNVDFKGYCPEAGKEIISIHTNNLIDINEIFEIKVFLKRPIPLKLPVRFKVLNRLLNRIQDAVIKITLNNKDCKIDNNLLATDENGDAITNITYDSGFDLCSAIQRSSKIASIEYVITKDGYYQISNSKKISRNNLIDEKITLIHPSDYFNKDFWRLNKYNSMREKVLSILDLVKLQSILKDCILKYDYIKIERFKEKNYVSFGFNELNKYNSIKLNQYEIARIIFDVVVRKILSPLNLFLYDSKEIDGYQLNISTETKNFIDKDAISKRMDFNFYLNKKDVANYKNNDITGQQLIDKTIILLNDERIDLRLQ